MIVTSDSSVITGLIAIDKLSILSDLFSKVIIPQAFYNELQHLSAFGYDKSQLDRDWIIVKKLMQSNVLIDLFNYLD